MTTELEPITHGDGTQAALDAGTRLAEPTQLAEGQDYAFLVPDGGSVEIVRNDLDQFRARPRRKTGTVTVRDAASFIAYVDKHGIEDTELWADPVKYALVAVLNAHGESDAAGNEEGWAGWGDHRVRLDLAKTRAWAAWESLDGKLVDQVTFAEHLEQRLADIRVPAGADMLELAQTFTGKRNVQFESSQRLADGQTQLRYHEQIDAKAGSKGDIAIPEAFELGLVPFEGAQGYKVPARFRYRIHDGALRLGYVLERPEDVLRSAFDDIVKAVDEGTTQTVFMGTP